MNYQRLVEGRFSNTLLAVCLFVFHWYLGTGLAAAPPTPPKSCPKGSQGDSCRIGEGKDAPPAQEKLDLPKIEGEMPAPATTTVREALPVVTYPGGCGSTPAGCPQLGILPSYGSYQPPAVIHYSPPYVQYPSAPLGCGGGAGCSPPSQIYYPPQPSGVLPGGHHGGHHYEPPPVVYLPPGMSYSQPSGIPQGVTTSQGNLPAPVPEQPSATAFQPMGFFTSFHGLEPNRVYTANLATRGNGFMGVVGLPFAFDPAKQTITIGRSTHQVDEQGYFTVAGQRTRMIVDKVDRGSSEYRFGLVTDGGEKISGVIYKDKKDEEKKEKPADPDKGKL